MIGLLVGVTLWCIFGLITCYFVSKKIGSPDWRQWPIVLICFLIWPLTAWHLLR